MASHRIAQVNELIKQELARILLVEEVFQPGSLVTITRVITSRDLGQAKVFLSVLPLEQGAAAIEVLEKRAGFLRGQLGKILTLRKMPRLRFLHDTTEAEAAHIDELIDKIQQG